MKTKSFSLLNSNLNLSLLIFMSLSLLSCAGDNTSASKEEETSQTPQTSDIVEAFNPEQGAPIDILDGVKVDMKNVFFDDFSDGISANDWIIGNGAWGHGNGGVIPQNISYTQDGVLLIRGNGLHYAKGEVKGVGERKDGANTGGAIISNFATGPGRYQVKMKPLSRQGACTALWTFSNQPVAGKENDNHEIDIELPGGKTGGVISFKNVLNTNYVTERLNTSQDINLEKVMGKKLFLNDNQYHTFGFDWYTDPELIVYYCDDVITAVSDTFIPDLQSKLWLGAWFPNNAGFVGQSYFETDYLYVDWVKYMPFLDQPSREFVATPSVAPANPNMYPTHPVAYPEVNLISNGDFEYIRNVKDVHKYGWTYSRLNNENQEASAVCFPGEESGNMSSGVTVKDGGYLNTVIDSVYEGYKYKLSFDGKSSGEDSRVVVNFINAISNKALEFKTINVKGNTWNHYEIEIQAPLDSYAIRLEAYNQRKASIMQLDNFVLERI